MTTAADPTVVAQSNPASTGVAAATPAQPAPGEEFKAMNAEQFKARLAEAHAAGERNGLKALGFEKLEDARARLAKAAEVEKAQLTESERINLELKTASAEATRAKALDATIAKFAKTQFDGLKSEAMKKYVIAIAGDDPQKRLDAIAAAEESGLFAELAKPAVVTTGEPQKLATSKAAGTPPLPANGTPEKRPKDMTKAEFSAYMAKRNAEKTAPKQ